LSATKKRQQTITTSIENTVEMSVIFAAMQQHNACVKTRHALPEIGVGWVLFDEILEEIGVKLREQVKSQPLYTTHSKIRSKLRKRVIMEKSQQVVGCT